MLAIRRTERPFKITPRHWYQWLSLGWWKQKRIMEALMAYLWENGVKEEIEKKIERHVLFGEPLQ